MTTSVPMRIPFEDVPFRPRAEGGDVAMMSVITGTQQGTELGTGFAPVFGQTSLEQSGCLLHARLAVRNSASYDVDGPAPTGQVGSNYDETDDEIWRTNLILTWDFDGIELKSSTSYVDANTD